MDKDGLTDDRWRKDWSEDVEEGRELLAKRKLPETLEAPEQAHEIIKYRRTVDTPFKFER